MYRMLKFLESLEHYELVRLKNEIDKGNLDFAKELQDKINSLEKKHDKSCTTCSNELDAFNSNNYTLIFGPEDFKKKASFCGLDCLEYFLTKIKDIKGDKNAKEIG